MNFEIRHSLLGLITAIGPFAYAQQAAELPSVGSCVKAEVKMPIVEGNGAFKHYVDGIADVNISSNFNVYRGIMIGVGAKYSYFQVDDFKVSQRTEGEISFLGIFGVLGFERYLNGNISYELCSKYGYGWMNTTTLICNDLGKDTYRQSGSYLEPQLALYYTSEEQYRFGLFIGYQVFMQEFTADNFCIPYFAGLHTSASQGAYQVLNVGLGVAINFRNDN